MRLPPLLLTPRCAILLLALLAGCVLAIAIYGTGAVLAGTSEPVASAAALLAQAAWQTAVVRGLHGGRWRTVAVQATSALVAFAAAGAVGLSGGSSFFAVASAVLVVMPVGAVASAWWAVRRAARAAPAPGSAAA